ncbi:hypothetical protein LTR36_009571 [Oleoguttula mirabilis]|uniref:H-type lectin domain-containing protein n=1 Tax=Oleoguttula mirabilis TaxID=1507867 RepID=A0AAV9JTB8_9PEZI|nr:hypothetical protein LTR36_009571 [Oleoguttula mirabilis]
MVQGVHFDRTRPDNGHFSTKEVRAPEEPCLSTSRLIAFPKNYYKQPPNLAAGFSSLDVSCEGPVRANLVADSITTSSFRIAVETWGNSTLFEASATWVEHKATAKETIFQQFDTDSHESSTIASTAPRARITKRHMVYTEPVPQKYGKPFFFPRPFSEPPDIVCWLNRLDLSSGPNHNYKVRAFADGVNSEGFSAHLNTWGDDGELHGAAMCWIAFPKRKKNVDSGRFSTNDVRKRTNPRPKTTSKVKFKQRFTKVPTVLAALNMIDAAGNADLRVKLSITEVDLEGFRWTLETWDDSTLYGAGASWIALGFS